jgi:hypothetical protein
VHSLAAWKTERYLFYALPMFFALWGLAIGGALPWLRERAATGLDSLFSGSLPPRVRGLLVSGALLASLAFVAFGSAATSWAVKFITVGDHEYQGGWGGYRGNPDWAGAAVALEDELRRSEVVLASYDVSAIYGIGRADYLLRHVGPMTGRRLDFFPRGKTPTPIVSTPASLELVMRCHATGLAIVESGHLRQDWATSDELVDFLEARTTQVTVPRALRLYVARWEREPAGTDAAACAEIADRLADRRR